MRTLTKSLVWSGTIVLALGLGTAVGQQSPPKEKKGVVIERRGRLTSPER
jgi:hypothetical protein